MKKIALWCLPAILLLFAGCSTSKLTTSWVSPQATMQGQHFNKVLVLGLLSAKNRAVKVNMENELAKGLNEMGVQTITATDIYGPTAFRGMSERQVMRLLHKDGIDGVVTIALVDKNVSRNYVPGYWGGPFWGYYSYYSPYMWGAPYSGYMSRTTSYSFETNLYNLQRKSKLLYSAQSETVDPSSPTKLAVDFSRTIVKDLKTKNLLR
ncbi:MAG TPA: hypothetical protein VFQ86_12655 [Arachidicoccus soli]|uniref:DUF4136 domain-containing protein n=1 Tax=Arachidicoccus soli TaxID=2341117 RepID=A0A386HLH5_9BACT|nr:hypothetical protein [Arachidicoccus soli]AYD46635.1 hypothetical protein D6B99_02790 [Arachidicoccus soli]HEU0228583.1 hypothetical protein [Arachidicoccus soli]